MFSGEHHRAFWEGKVQHSVRSAGRVLQLQRAGLLQLCDLQKHIPDPERCPCQWLRLPRQLHLLPVLLLLQQLLHDHCPQQLRQWQPGLVCDQGNQGGPSAPNSDQL